MSKVQRLQLILPFVTLIQWQINSFLFHVDHINQSSTLSDSHAHLWQVAQLTETGYAKQLKNTHVSIEEEGRSTWGATPGCHLALLWHSNRSAFITGDKSCVYSQPRQQTALFLWWKSLWSQRLKKVCQQTTSAANIWHSQGCAPWTHPPGRDIQHQVLL